MPVIAIQQDPSCVDRPTLHKVDNGTNVLEWLIDNVEFPERLGVTVMLNGDTIADIDQHSEQEFNCNIDFEVNDRDSVVLIYRPRGLEPATWAIIIAVSSLAISLALAPKPSLPNETGKTTSSPNNQLQGSTNQFRFREAIPDIAGQVKSFPDFIQSPYFEYENNVKVLREDFCIGIGRYVVERVSSGETLIDTMPTSAWQTFDVTNMPATLETAAGVEELRNLPLITRQDPSRFADVTGGTIDGGASEIDVNDAEIIDQLTIIVGSQLRLTGEYFDTNTGQIEDINATVTVNSISGSILGVAGLGGQQSDAGTWNGGVEIATEDTTSADIVLPYDDATELWFNIDFPQGIRASGGGNLVISLAFEYQQIDEDGNPIGSAVTEVETVVANTASPQYRTFKYSVPEGKYRVNATNASTFDSGGNAAQSVVLADAYSVKSYSTAGFGDVQILKVTRRASAGAASSSQKINALVTRKLQTFISGSTYVATRWAADYVYYILSTQASEPDSQINTDELFDQIPSDELGYFDFTFDDVNIGMRERIETACNVARVRYFNLPRPRWNFVREEAQQVRVAMFTRRNILPASSSQVYKFQRTADYDSVEIRYTDPADNTEAVISRRWNGSAIVSGTGFRPLEIDLAGCRNTAQATNRAELEIRKLVYQRRQVNDTVMNEGQFLGLGQVISWADPNDSEIFAGEIAGIDGSTYDTYERVYLEDGATYFILITDESGNVSNTATVTARTDTDYGFIASGLSGAFVASGAVQLGSQYFIYKEGELTDLLITSLSRPDEVGNVGIEAYEYVEQVFEQD